MPPLPNRVVLVPAHSAETQPSEHGAHTIIQIFVTCPAAVVPVQTDVRYSIDDHVISLGQHCITLCTNIAGGSSNDRTVFIYRIPVVSGIVQASKAADITGGTGVTKHKCLIGAVVDLFNDRGSIRNLVD